MFANTSQAFETNRGNHPGTIVPRDYNFKRDLADDIPYHVLYPKQTTKQVCGTIWVPVNNHDSRPQRPLVEGLARFLFPHSGRIVYEQQYYCRPVNG